MAGLLYLVHRIPYPPNKGDKIRSWNILKHLARRVPVHLGCFIDDPADDKHRAKLDEICASTCYIPLDPRRARIASSRGLITGEALTFPYYRNSALRGWVASTLAQEDIAAQLAFSGCMAPYLAHRHPGPRVIDFIDVDSDKWARYAESRRGPMRWVYQRESRLLAKAEARLAAAATAATVVTEQEAALFRSRSGLGADRIHAVANGVDTERFRPAQAGETPPFSGDAPTLVFTGAMDYWPNVEGILWFVDQVLPMIQAERPDLRLYVVGSKPDARLTALDGRSGITVTGLVPDTLPYIQHATVAIAPLRIARGIQNKVLEAMACGRAVVATEAAFEGLEAEPGSHLEVQDRPEAFADTVLSLIADEARRAALGGRARAAMLERYSWDARLSRFDTLLGLS